MSHYFNDLTHLRLGENYRNILVRFFVQVKTLKFASEINRPLLGTKFDIVAASYLEKIQILMKKC